MFDAHPHIGTDYLLVIAKKMRDYLKSLGTEIKFTTRFETFETSDPSKTQSTKSRYKISLSDGTNLHTDHLVMAVGHSARDTYEMLLEKGVAIEPNLSL